MNLLEAISLSELKAGGPGSGCRGPNCGRPRSRDLSDNMLKQIWKKTPAPEPVRIAYPKITPKSTPIKELSPPQKLYRQFLRKQAEGVEKMQSHIPTAILKDGTSVKEGDTVKVLKPIVAWNQKTGNNDTYPAGKKATVVNVLPKVGTASQQISVQVKKHHDPTYFGADDVKLHKSAGPTTIETEPVPKSKIKQQFTSNDGSQVTIVKTQETRDYEPRTIKDLANQSSRFKGQFDQVEKVAGADNQTTRVYDTSKVPSRAWGKREPAQPLHVQALLCGCIAMTIMLPFRNSRISVGV